MPVDDLFKNYREVRDRLRRPKNSVPDHGIDLTRKSTAYKGDDPPPGTPIKPPIEFKIYPEKIVLPLVMNDVIDAVSAFYGFTVREIKGESRLKKYQIARRMIVHLALKLLHPKLNSLSSIGRSMNRDHTTILHAKKKITEQMDRDEVSRLQAGLIEEAILAKNHNRSTAAAIEQPLVGDGSESNVQNPGIQSLDQTCGGSLASAEARQRVQID